MRNPGRVLTGVVLILAGVLFLLDVAGLLDAGAIVGTWWPLVVIAFGLAALTGPVRSVPAAVILILIGAVLQASTLDMLPVTARELILPLVLIAVGAGLLAVRSGFGDVDDPSNAVRAFAVFGGQEIRSRSEAFRGGSLTALFGGIDLDLREATLHPDGAGLDTFAAFGGVDIIVPRGWKVNVRGMPLLGAVEDSSGAAREGGEEIAGGGPDGGAPTLTVSGIAMLGGVEVKNEPG